MDEEELYQPIKSELGEKLPDKFDVRVQERVVYDKFYSSESSVRENDEESQNYETDIAIFRADVPLVILEVKKNDASSHDIMDYSRKAKKHKQTYPFLRYGMLIVGEDVSMTKKVLWHNEWIDFFYFRDQELGASIEDYKVEKLVNLLKEKLEVSEQLQDVLEDGSNPEIFNRKIEME